MSLTKLQLMALSQIKSEIKDKPNIWNFAKEIQKQIAQLTPEHAERVGNIMDRELEKFENSSKYMQIDHWVDAMMEENK